MFSVLSLVLVYVVKCYQSKVNSRCPLDYCCNFELKLVCVEGYSWHAMLYLISFRVKRAGRSSNAQLTHGGSTLCTVNAAFRTRVSTTLTHIAGLIQMWHIGQNQW